MANIKDIFVRLRGDNKGAKKAINDTKTGMASLGDMAKKAGTALAGAFAVKQVIQFGKASLDAYDKQAKAEQSLLVALGGRKMAQEALIAQAQKLQKTTLFGDEETIKAQALIAAFVEEEEQIKQVIPLVQDLAAAKGMDLANAADLVSKTLGSSTNALSRYGIEVTGAVGSAQRLESLMLGLNSAFGGQAEAAAKAGTGGLTQLKNVWGDITEQIGESIVILADLNTNLAAISQTLSTIDLVSQVKYWKEWKDNNQILVKSMQSLTAPMKLVVDYNKMFFKWVTKGNDELEESPDLIDGAKKAYNALGGAVDGVVSEFREMLGIEKDVEETEEEINKKEEARIAGIKAKMEARREERAAQDAVRGSLDEYNSVLDKNISLLDEEIQGMLELEGVLDGAKQGFDKLAIAAFNAAEVMNGSAPSGTFNKMLQNIEILRDYAQELEKAGYSGEAFKVSSEMTAMGLDAVKKGLGEAALAMSGQWAQSIGQAIGAGEGFGKVLADIGSQIASALGDILIYVGTAMGVPAGVPFILAGLGAKMVGGLINGFSSRGIGDSSTMQPSNGLRMDSVLYGNDIRTSVNHSNTLYGRVG